MITVVTGAPGEPEKGLPSPLGRQVPPSTLQGEALDGDSPLGGTVSETDEITDRRSLPWVGQQLPRAKLHVHVEILCLSACRKGLNYRLFGLSQTIGTFLFSAKNSASGDWQPGR